MTEAVRDDLDLPALGSPTQHGRNAVRTVETVALLHEREDLPRRERLVGGGEHVADTLVPVEFTAAHTSYVRSPNI